MTNYTRIVTSSSPATFLFLIDRSGSMREKITFHGLMRPKCEAVAIAFNTIIDEILNRSKRENGYKDYFRIAAMGYNDSSVHPLLGATALDPFVTPSQLMERTPAPVYYEAVRTLSDGSKTTVSLATRQWITPRADGRTPMGGAMYVAEELIGSLLRDILPQMMPPILFHITDGEASDASDKQLLDSARRLRSFTTEGGPLLFFNIHISSEEQVSPILFPDSPEQLGENRYARLLYEMSSEMPDIFNDDIRSLTGRYSGNSFRAMSFNATMTDLLKMLSIGTVTCDMI